MQTQNPKQMYRVVDPNKDLQTDVKLKNIAAEARQYLVCLAAKEDATDVPDNWQIVTGRSEARELIIANIEDIDLQRSFVLVDGDGVTLKDRVSVYAFMKHIEQFYPQETFDIEEYVRGDFSEREYRQDNEIDPIFKENRTITPEDMMIGNAAIPLGY